MIAFALALALQAASAPAAPPPGAQPRMSPEQQLQAITGILRSHGMSAAGIQKVTAGLNNGLQIMRGYVPRLEGTSSETKAAAFAVPFNPGRFEASLRAQSSLSAEINKRQADNQISLFHNLSPADQKVYAQMLASTARGPGQPAH